MEFEELNIIKPILKVLKEKGYVEPTPIQEKTIPLLLDHKDVIGIAQTGTGKTAAFAIPVLQKLHERSLKTTTPRALILAPTRELAAQISESFKIYGKFLSFKHLAIYGGVKTVPQIRALERGVDILIATPGRLIDLMNQGKIDFRKIEFLVFDEADRMLDMGFMKDVKKIASALPVEKQSLFFSATMSNQIADLTRDFLKNPTRVEITPQSTPVEKIEQCVFYVDQENKNELLLDLISQQKMSCILIFVAMKHKADKVATMLNRAGINADAIHGNKSQFQRTRALNNFKIGKIKVLVATDIAARGIDINNISHVINYDLPNEPENYVHRIGRTARAGNEGTAYSFCAADERNYLHQIERITKRKMEHAEHKYHSLRAKNATGADAKPRPRRRGGGGRGRSGSQSRERDSKPRGRDSKPRGRSDGESSRGRPRGRKSSDSRGRSSSGARGRSSSNSRGSGRSGFGGPRRRPGSQDRGRSRSRSGSGNVRAGRSRSGSSPRRTRARR
ncbi:DEAD/DEAH box helicase [archaeon]|jgi:ATP-dependent RNA helicase RhlE|nr:DEAD/DEAH box helicase [archaeon]MBT3578028.1 DEAD/DEAH box helicase [archaeon]MBT6819999.1 DEAD/DEAH box helicase [archaeon]MBT7025036.1 DEAD/DEAH box helicase [archaeon]MBT7238655.1 DEAD/DEAH box helicase [archaeon]